MRNKIRMFLVAFIAVIIQFGVLFSVSRMTSVAKEGGGNSGSVDLGKPGCYEYQLAHGLTKESSVFWDTCFGMSWREHEATSDRIQIYNGNRPTGKYVEDCLKWGGKYYILEYEKYYTDSKKAVGQQTSASQVKYVTSTLEGGSGNGRYYMAPGVLPWDKIKSMFDEAERRGATKTTWPETSWFCYDPGWENPGSQFNSWSYGSVDQENHFDTFPSPDDTEEKEIETEAESVVVTFEHQLSYVPPSAQGEYGSAYTEWHNTVTIDGAQVYQSYDQRYVENNGGPGDGKERFSEKLGRWSEAVEIPEGGSKKVCSTISYKKKKIVWKDQDSRLIMDESESNGDGSSTACVTIKRALPKNVGGSYASQTTVRIPAQGEDINQTYEITTEEDGKNYGILISTDGPSVDIEFSHRLNYHGTICPPETDHDYICDEYAWTDYDIVNERDSNVDSGTHKENEATHAEETVEPVTITLDKGETKRVCRKIVYHSKNITFSTNGTTDHIIDGVKFIDTHWKISAHGGDDYSEACATVTRPADPDIPGPGKIQGPSSGSNDATPMYAGEDATISWETSAPTYDVRRLMQWQAISFQVPVFTVYNNELSLGNIGKDERRTLLQDPCEWYNLTRRTRYRGCEVSASSRSDDNPQYGQGNEHAYQWNDGQFVNKTAEVSGNQAILRDVFKAGPFGENIVVPNLVGDKHCNSFGFQFQYYYAYVKNGSAEWHKDTTNRPYWVVYDAACRAIAKKPSVATWNGGLFSGNGGITTSIANRFDNTALNTLTASGGPRNSFGSWSEYLATINGGVEGYTSGTVLSWHGVPTPFDITANSPLTIANGSSIGNSLIAPNSILYNRLQDYLFSQNESYNHKYSGNQVSSRMADVNLGPNMSGTTIISIDGKLTIDRDIKINTSNQPSIYTLPQVVIYAKDGIDITNDVKQIDAWLVTDGELNTCRNDGNELFIKDVTEARVNGWSRNVNCDNELVINGPVFAKKVTLNRTYGADGFSNNDQDLAEGDSRAATGEIFNLSADSYLWAWVQSGRYASSYSEAYSRELPPRY